MIKPVLAPIHWIHKIICTIKCLVMLWKEKLYLLRIDSMISKYINSCDARSSAKGHT